MVEETKLCSGCKVEKSRDLFYNRDAGDGKQPQCKQCANDYVYISKGYRVSSCGRFYLHDIRGTKKRTNYDAPQV
jgi:hypothetical protein